ncbi:MAG: gamma-glutamyltransferase family protein [Candidatus Thiodiazotropha sp.]
MPLTNQSHAGLAVAPHAQAAESAASILAEGGNALEACISMAATLAIVYPHMTGLGGDSFWLLHKPGDAAHCILGSGRSARKLDKQFYLDQGLKSIPYRGGSAAITLAGTVSGWEQAQAISNEQWQGRLPLSRLLADALRIARNGYRVTESQARATSDKLAQLAHQPGFAEVFLSQGQAPQSGDKQKQPAMAETFEQLIRSGLHDFYQGELAESIAQDLARAGSPLTLTDLHQHQLLAAKPLSLKLGSATIYTTPPPTQGAATLMILGQFARRPLTIAQSENADTLHWLVEATKQAFCLRNREIRDPDRMAIVAEQLISDPQLDRLAATIDSTTAAPWKTASHPSDTTWFGAIDKEGRSVSCIQSIYHEFGSGLVLPQSGLCWHNRGTSFSLLPGHPLELKPNTLPLHTLCPSMAHFDDGRRMVFGTMGGDGQPQTQSILFTRYAEYGQSLEEAIAAPRWLLGHAWGDTSDSLKLESRFGPALVENLRNRGHDIEVLDAYEEMMGHAGAILRHPDGRIEGAADPRSDGAAVAAEV